MKRIISILIAITALVSTQNTFAETNRHLYFKGDISNQSLVGVLIGEGIAAVINNYTHDFTYDNLWSLNTISGHKENSPVPGSNYLVTDNHYGSGIFNPFSFKLKEMFGNFGTGIKLGYQSDNYGFFNWAAYGSLHYRMNYFDFQELPYGNTAEDFMENMLYRVQFGIGINTTLGRVIDKAKFRIDANIRYNIPIGYNGPLGSGSSVLNSGLSTCIGIVWGGPTLFEKTGMNIGISYEWTNYNVFKESQIFQKPYSAIMHSFYITFTLCPNNFFK